ncbi:trimeric intracellular cation channel family protein [Oceanobacter mangrovi]|uniref:trimeric intracellular cation channel family protein n=1 Tax=Oceanobacter mangrovi TaxID=2862510 RepID=UPI001C8ED3CE|nr:trimeric intracellular cation channel family protein [Oceanobacter mangrovi]
MEIPADTSLLLYWLTMLASIFSAAAGVIDARNKQFDLFGVLIIAFCAALGGGTLRDVILDRPVFWIGDSSYLVFTWLGALGTFYIARKIELSPRWFEIPDAVALALYTIAGTQASLMMGTDWLIASFMGVITGVAGGILRDVLLNEEPLVFKGPFYATASWSGSLLYAVLWQKVDPNAAVMATGVLIILIRISAIRWDLHLPR